jgi:hypothetical protein
VVLGQKDFLTADEPDISDPSKLTASVMGTPAALLLLPDGSVLVADSDHRRLLKFMPGVPLFPPGAVLPAANLDGNGLAAPQKGAQRKHDLF